MRKHLLLLLTLSIVCSQLSIAQWLQQTAPTGTGNLYSVFAINQNAVASAGFQKIIRTADAGVTWGTPLTVTGTNYYTVHTKEPLHWYSLALNSTWFIITGNPNGTSLLSGKPDNIYALHFLSAKCGVGVGSNGKVVTTCDTGQTWTTRPTVTSSTLRSVWFANATTACACGTSGGIIRTTNSGTSWSAVTSPVTQQLNGITFPTGITGYAAGNTGTLLKTTDAGVTWTALTSGVTNNLNGIFFINADTGYVVGTAGLIIKTIDGGTTWNAMTTPTTQVLNSVHFISPTQGWAVGNNATILKFDNSFNAISSPEKINTMVNVFPNPASSSTTISVDAKNYSPATIKARDITGREIKNIYEGIIYEGENDFTFDASLIPKGIYFIIINTEEGNVVKKFIVE